MSRPGVPADLVDAKALRVVTVAEGATNAIVWNVITTGGLNFSAYGVSGADHRIIQAQHVTVFHPRQESPLDAHPMQWDI